DKLVLGIGVGYARDKADIGTDGTHSEASGVSGAAYGSYQPAPNIFVDALLGYGTLSFDSDRYVTPINTMAHAHRTGDQLFGSVALGYEHVREGLLVSPYGGLSFSIDRLKQATETDAGSFGLTYFDEKTHTLRSNLGVRVESSHMTNVG